ncbi:MAG: sugar phosphate isomerase/epimerase [Defluviitaleaceae bacterium]|nr:sugar phosphate isomerase/epimerase [Defluviitaleaceae bacterium]
MPIGLAPYTIRFNVVSKESVEEAYRKISEMGYRGLEGGLGRGQGIKPEDDVKLLAKYGLSVCDVYADASNPAEAMKLARAYGTKYVCVGTVPGGMMMTADGFKAYAAQLNKLAEPYAKEGFMLSYHNHAQEFRNFSELGGKTGLEILIEETDPKGVCFVLDVFWASAAGADPAHWLRRLKGRINLAHFKDYAIDDQTSISGFEMIPWRFAEVGRGNINWKAVVEACGYAGVEWYCVEQDFTRGDAFACLKTSIDFMRGELKLN